MIRYIIRSLKNPRSGTVKLYPQIAPTHAIMRKEVIKDIEKLTSLSSSDIKSCLDALEYQISRYMASGVTVRLGDLGSFRPTICAEGTTDPEQCNSSLIKYVRCRFTPSGQLRADLAVSNLSFQPYKPQGNTSE